MPNSEFDKYHVLYLEDDTQDIAINFSDIQNLLDIQFVFAQTVEDAVRLIGSNHFDLFILDIEIKHERATGIQIAEQIRRSPSYATTPILFTSMHTHYSNWLFSKIRNCAFLPKPFTQEDFIAEIGIALGIPQYWKKHYASPVLLLPLGKEIHIEIDPHKVSYIEATNRSLLIQYIDGESIQTAVFSGVFKNILEQIQTHRVTCLRQIYRSIIINVNQIKKIELKKNIASIYLFNEAKPLPLGMRYRKNIQEFV